MWNPVRIEFKNLFSHKNSSYDFNQNTCTVIFGENETDEGFENNGSGKTTLFEAISLSMIGDSLRDVDKEKFINREEEDCEIIFELRNEFLKKDLVIYRKFFRGSKSSIAKIFEDGVENKKLVSVGEVNKEILKIIGISREDLLHYYIISQDSRYSFFTANDVDKKEILNRITSADMINPIIEKLTFDYKEKTGILSTLNNEVDKLSSNIELIEEQKAQALLEDNTAEEIKELEEEKSDMLAEAKKYRTSINQIKADITKTENEIAKESKKIKIDKNSLLTQKKQKRQELEECNSTIKKLKLELESEVECPECKTHFLVASDLVDITPETARELLVEANEISENLLKEFEDIIEKIDEVETIECAISDLKGDLKSYKDSLPYEQRRLESLNNKVEKIDTEIEDLKNKKKDNKIIKQYDDKILEFKDKISGLAKKITEVNSEIEMITFWQYYMGKTGFSTYLANKSIKVIEGMTNSFLKKFKVNLTVLINGFTVLKTGAVRDKIDVYIQNDGITSEPYKAKSGGEKGRVNIAGILGLQHLINLSSDGRGLNLLCLDEVFPGIDPRGQENMIKILEQVGVTILMITQNVSSDFNAENVLIVRKVDSISEYKK